MITGITLMILGALALIIMFLSVIVGDKLSEEESKSAGRSIIFSIGVLLIGSILCDIFSN